MSDPTNEAEPSTSPEPSAQSGTVAGPAEGVALPATGTIAESTRPVTGEGGLGADGDAAQQVADEVAGPAADPPEVQAADEPVTGSVSAGASEGFGPLEDPPRLEGVPLIGDPEKPMDEEAAADTAGGSAAAGADEEFAPESVSGIDPALLAIAPELAVRAGEISEETTRIGQEVAGIEQSQAFTEADELKPVEEEST